MPSPSGEQHHEGKLSWVKVDAIRAAAAAGERLRDIAERYPEVSTAMVHKVIHRQAWNKQPRN